MDLDEDVKPSARKRKRSGPKASTRAGVKNAKVPSLTPSTKTNVRLKGQTSTARSVTVESVRVFAVWKAEARFFSGTVKSLGSKANHFLIAFDDETEAEVGIHQMRRCELRVGDEVVLIEGGKRAAVINVDQFMEEGSVRVEMVDSKSVLEVKPSAVKISSRSILAQWKDRTLAVGDIVPTRSSKPLQVTPSPSRTSTHSSSKPLARMGFVFTTSATGVKREREEEKMKHALTSNGGVLLGDWKEIYHVQGKQDSKRWIITPDDIQYKQNKRIDQVFLLADDANQKPKYLKALALGIPCLEIAWLYTSHHQGDGLDWKSSLLAAGFSDRLNACVSQLVDLDWGSSPSHLSDVMANTVAPKIFTGKSILLVGLEYFPLGKGRKNAGQSSDNNDASREVPSIILFMGAERVETVKDADHASASFEEYDYIVMKDVDDNAEGEGNPKEKGMHVSVEWVKDCLISGRILRTP
ncbi:hypothetical protein OF83DRAFT_1049803 [Amylostereum chailletii]|nr:hypothetical protein OF83DRAFT_1049803 [Amylostereum chailletii]